MTCQLLQATEGVGKFVLACQSEKSTPAPPHAPLPVRVTICYPKVYDRLLRPLIAADAPTAPADLRRALTTIDRQVRGYAEHARPGKAA